MSDVAVCTYCGKLATFRVIEGEYVVVCTGEPPCVMITSDESFDEAIEAWNVYNEEDYESSDY